MKTSWKWFLGILAALVVIATIVIPFVVSRLYHFGGYGMMGYGWYMPMMAGGYPMMGFGMLFSALFQLGLLILIVLGIIWLVRAIGRQDQKGS